MGKTLLYPDEPIAGFLSADLIDSETRTYLEKCSKALYELVCVGTHLLLWEFEAAHKSQYEAMAVSAFFRRILQLLDAISIQIKEGALDTCEIHLRSLIETWLGFEYLIKEDTEKRSRLFFLYEYNHRKRNMEKYTPEINPKKYNTLQNKYKYKGFLVKKLIPVDDRAERIAFYNTRIDEIISEDNLKKEFDLVRDKNNLKWYNIGSNLTNVADLAIALERFDIYDLYYQQYNSPTHGTNLMSEVFSSEGEYTSILEIRNPKYAEDVTRLAVEIGSFAYAGLATRFSKDKKEEIHFRLSRLEKQHFGFFKKT